MEAEHFNGLDKGDFYSDDGVVRAKDASGDSSAYNRQNALKPSDDTAETDEMHGTRRRRMLKAEDKEKTLHYGYNGAAGLEKVNNARG